MEVVEFNFDIEDTCEFVVQPFGVTCNDELITFLG